VAKILLVDDDARMRRALGDILTAAGHEVVEAINGDEGLRLFQERAPDVVITEVVMPRKDGIEIIAALREWAFDGPIIAISGGNPTRRAVYLRLARITGADESLAEPFSASELTEAIERLQNARERP
jgi:DNA-binding response OmpR family regulator